MAKFGEKTIGTRFEALAICAVPFSSKPVADAAKPAAEADQDKPAEEKKEPSFLERLRQKIGL